MRLAFMGSPDFAVPSLDRLLEDGHAVRLVVTQPDRPAGRGRDLTPPPVKQAAERHDLPLLQAERLTDPVAQAALQAAQPEVIVVVAFGQFLPRAVRGLPPKGCVNVHASLLPKYRGAAPIARAVMAGERETGVSLMRVEARMDAGPVMLQRACPIAPEDDAGSLEGRLALLGAEVLAEGLDRLAHGRADWRPQDDRLATLAPKIGEEDRRLMLAGGASELVNRVRGLSPAPGAFLLLADGRRLKVLRAETAEGAGAPGRVLVVEPDVLVVGAGRGALALREVQPEGKRRMTGGEFARGRRLRAGEWLVEPERGRLQNAECGIEASSAERREPSR